MSSTDILEKKYKRAPECSYRDIQGEVVIVSSKTSGVHLLNSVGSFIWSLLDGSSSCNEIVQKLCEEFEVEPETARDDLKDFLISIQRTDIIRVCA